MDIFQNADTYKRFCDILKKYNLKLEKINNSSEINNIKPSILTRYIIEESELEENGKVCNEKLHPYLNQLDKADTSILDNVDDIINVVINQKQKRPKIFVKNVDDLKKNYLVLDEYPSDQKISRLNTLKKDFTDATTDFIVKNFFTDPNKYYSFISKLIKLVEDCIDKYKKIKSQELGIDLNDKILFMFKGGNLLRSVFLKFTQLLPNQLSDKIIDHYNEQFKSSDLDFQIFIHPQLGNNPAMYRNLYNIVYEDMINLSYLCLNRFRNYYIQNLASVFDFYTLNNQSKLNLLEKLRDKLNASKIITDTNYPNNYFLNAKFVNIQFYDLHTNKDIYNFFMINKDEPSFKTNKSEYSNTLQKHVYGEFSRRDFYLTSKILKDNTNKNMTYFIAENLSVNKYMKRDKKIVKQIYPKNEIQSEFYTSINDAVEFFLVTLVKFALVRTKINFIGYIQFADNTYGAMHLPGELIDISISAYDDSKNFKFENELFSNHFSRYTFVNQNSNYNIPSFEYTSYNLRSFIADLELILFNDNEFPWLDKKYDKRLKRMYVLAFAELFSLNKTQFNLNGVNKLRELLQLIKNIYTTSRLINAGTFVYDDINTSLTLLNQLNLNKIGMYTIQTYFVKVLKRLDSLDSVKKQEQLIELDKFNIQCMIHIDFFISILDDMDVYLNSDRVLHYDQSLFKKITQLGGVENVYNKYLKYKGKYLTNKN